jgi:hypothetical protein
MNAIKSIVAVIATVAAGASFAQEATPDMFAQARSVTSREAVAAEARDALAAGRIGFGEAFGHDFTNMTASTLSRKQVVAEAIEAQRLGLTQAGEVSRFATAADHERIERAGRLAISTNLASR